MSGTVVTSDKPAAVVGGHGRPHYGNGPADSIHQQIPQIRAWGHEYAIAPYPSRNEDHSPGKVSYRIMGAVNGTQLTYDWPTAGPSVINAGEVVDFANEWSFVVRSQDADHPFLIGQHMSSSRCVTLVDPGDGGLPYCEPPGLAVGDPEFVLPVPVAQQLSRYLFFTDPTYRYTYLIFTRRRDDRGYFHDVMLDCVGTVTGWTKMGSTGEFEAATVPLVENAVRNGQCDNGQHTASSDNPFGLTVWGLDEAVSYAYPAGGHLAPTNGVEIPPAAPK